MIDELAVIVLNHGTPESTCATVRSLLRSQRVADHILVVDNGDGVECRNALAALDVAIEVLPTGSNLGYSAGMNVGITEVLARGATLVLLLNSDVQVPPGAIDAMLVHRRLLAGGTAGQVGIVGPLVRRSSPPQSIESAGIAFNRATGRMRQIAHGEPLPPGDRSTDVDAVSGCAMLVDRAVFDVAGLLDEAYFFGFEDIDFCLRARQAGFRTVVMHDVTVFHEGSHTIGGGSPLRLYYAARNHQRLTAAHGATLTRPLRAAVVLALTLAYALRPTGGSVVQRLRAVARGTWHAAVGRFGAGT